VGLREGGGFRRRRGEGQQEGAGRGRAGASRQPPLRMLPYPQGCTLSRPQATSRKQGRQQRGWVRRGGGASETTRGEDNERGLSLRVTIGGALPAQGGRWGWGAPPPVRVPAVIEMQGRDRFRFTVVPEAGEGGAPGVSAETPGGGGPALTARSRTMTRQMAAEAAMNLMPYDVAGVLFNTDRSSRR